MSEIRLPNITAPTTEGQLLQVKSYLHQLALELDFAMKSTEVRAAEVALRTASSASSEEGKSAQAKFNDIKALIIKSADVINAYYDVIKTRLDGVFVAESVFGTYVEETASVIEANSKSITAIFESAQGIITDIDNLEHSLVEVTGVIKTGILYYDDQGVPIIGLEIGQTTEIDGVKTFNKYARFISDRLSFYDRNGNEVAYVSDRKLYITDVEIRGTMRMGGFKDTVLEGGSIVTKWVGTEG